VCTAFYTALICRESHCAIEAICSLPSTTHGQTKRSPTNCSACNPHPFPKPPHTHTQTHMQMHAQLSQAARSERSQGNWTDSGFLSALLQSSFSLHSVGLLNASSTCLIKLVSSQKLTLFINYTG